MDECLICWCSFLRLLHPFKLWLRANQCLFLCPVIGLHPHSSPEQTGESLQGWRNLSTDVLKEGFSLVVFICNGLVLKPFLWGFQNIQRTTWSLRRSVFSHWKWEWHAHVVFVSFVPPTRNVDGIAVPSSGVEDTTSLCLNACLALGMKNHAKKYCDLHILSLLA